MLRLEGLKRCFGDIVALDGIDLAIEPAQVFGLLGPNGAGKTTVMRIVMGLLIPDAGGVTFDGRAITRDDRLRFGYLPEERGLYPEMGVMEHLVYLGRIHGMTTADATKVATTWLDRLDLSERAKSKVGTLSLGNQQRVQLAAALIHDPDVLILDEPYSGLDPVAIDTMSGVLADVAAKGATVVFSSHQLDLVEAHCRSVGILDRGKVVASGEVDTLTAVRNHIVLEVDGASFGWPNVLRGVAEAVAETNGRVRLKLTDGTDPQDVLRQAQALGTVSFFSVARRRLSEAFREAVGR